MGVNSGNLTNGNPNIFIGSSAGYGNTTGNSNVFIGGDAGYNNISGNNNLFIGCGAGFYETGSCKLYISAAEDLDLITGDFSAKNLVLPRLCLCETPSSGNLSDSVLLWNSTDKCVKSIPISSITSGSTGGITTANNGLNVVGTNVRLGGALTGETCFTGGYNINFCSGSSINLECGFHINHSYMFRTYNSTILSSIYIGDKAGSEYNGYDGNNAFGYKALTEAIVGNNNIAIGNNTLATISESWENFAIGSDVASILESGSRNVMIGNRSGEYILNGSDNLFIGYLSGCEIIDAIDNQLRISNCVSTLISGDFDACEVTLPRLCLCVTPSSGSETTDKILVWNSTDKCVKTLTSSFCTKQDKNLVFTNLTVSSWSASIEYSGYGYEAVITTTRVTSSDIATVIFGHNEAVSGNYSPISLTSTDSVKIFSKVNTAITIPTIIVYVV